MANRNGSEFIVKLSGVNLPREAEERIEKEIRGTVLRELAKIDLRGDLATTLSKLRDWRGIWLEKVASLKIPKLKTTVG